MHATSAARTAPAARSQNPASSRRIDSFLAETDLETPFLVIDLSGVASKYLDLRRALPVADIYYAVKANPAPEIIRALADMGSYFDVASPAEIEQCLAHGIPASRLSFGNTIKKASAIAYAHASGVNLFSFDCAAELRKIARNAPGADVTVRLLTQSKGAEWPLSRKFGCDAAMALDLMLQAPGLGLRPHGVSFHVGSQQTDPGQWDEPIAIAANLFRQLAARGIRLETVNIGGGFPARYTTAIPSIEAYGARIEDSLHRHFGPHLPRVMAEPGRYLVAEAGVIQTEIVLIARKSYVDDTRWVYLDCGKFGGLVETMDEAIKYPLRTPGDPARLERVILAGPTCDSADILYEKTAYALPVDLQEGDLIQILSAGAYTHTYSSIGFNGFSPLRAICV